MYVLLTCVCVYVWTGNSLFMHEHVCMQSLSLVHLFSFLVKLSKTEPGEADCRRRVSKTSH